MVWEFDNSNFQLTWCDIIQRVVIGFMVVMPGSYLFLQQDRFVLGNITPHFENWSFSNCQILQIGNDLT